MLYNIGGRSDIPWGSVLEGSEYSFHLTGSRFFGCHDSGSDWDFLAEDRAGLERWLHSRGMRRTTKEGYSLAYGLQSIWASYDELIHIQVVDNLQIRLDAQDFLFGYEVFRRGVFPGVSREEAKRIRNLIHGAVLEAFVESRAGAFTLQDAVRSAQRVRDAYWFGLTAGPDVSQEVRHRVLWILEDLALACGQKSAR